MNAIEKNENVEKSLTVMLVEDNEIARLYTSALLKQMNCHVVYAETGEEAVAKFSKEVNGVLMDLELPGIGGCQATQMIRRQYHENTPIFACSTCDTSCKGDCIQAGMNGYIQKPCREDELKYFVKEMIRRKNNKEDKWLRAI